MADDGLVAFLRARLDEDEQAARSAEDDGWEAEDVHSVSVDLAEHIARHAPARVLAEVDAKRRILDAWPDSFGLWSADQADAAKTMKVAVLLLLAVPYAEHPDYRPEWSPR